MADSRQAITDMVSMLFQVNTQEIKLSSEFGELENLNDTEKLVLRFIAEKELVSTSEISKYIGKTDRTARRIVAKLEENGLIIWVGMNEKDPNKKYKLKMS